MKVLIIGAGVIGTVYGAILAEAGHTVAVLRHPPRTDAVAALGLRAVDEATGRVAAAPAEVVSDPGSEAFDLVLVAVRGDQSASVTDQLSALAGAPAVLLFGNIPSGSAALPTPVPGSVHTGFPGIGGELREGIAHYLVIRQQPTAVEASDDPRLAELRTALARYGLGSRLVADMEGWRAYHAAFIGCVTSALYRCDTNAAGLAADSALLRLMCRAIGECFDVLHRAGVRGRPRGLWILHTVMPTGFAVGYWARILRSPMGELCFAAHARHAPQEMRQLADRTLRHLGDGSHAGHAVRLLHGSATEPPAS